MYQVSPKIKEWLNQYNAVKKELINYGFKPTPTSVRENFANITKEYVPHVPDNIRDIIWKRDDLVPGDDFSVPIRIYHPDPERALPILVYYHGGGHMVGSITVYDPICTKLAFFTKHIVISVDYRLAPECPYPAGLNDAYTVVKNLWSTLDERKMNYAPVLSIAGDSGGGALVASVSAMSLNDPSVSIYKQIMIYPSLDYTMSCDSINELATGFFLEKNTIRWYFENYFSNGGDRKAASPINKPITDNLPDTLLFTAEFCPLKDEGKLYVTLAEKAGVNITHYHFENMIHAFLNLENLAPDECTTVYQEIDSFLNQ
jgi:acetyl esterase/lipase